MTNIPVTMVTRLSVILHTQDSSIKKQPPQHNRDGWGYPCDGSW
jgi:hypothetical protein